MENLTKEINSHFSNKYNFLQLLEVVYDKEKMKCKIVFLYPENKQEITILEKKEILEFLNSFLNLNAKFEIKYKKSYLDGELIKKFLIDFFKNNNFSLFSTLQENDIIINKDLASILVTLKFKKEIEEYVLQNNLIGILRGELTKNFIANFEINVEKSDEEIDEQILEKREEELPVVLQKKVARYEVFNPLKIFGKEISPFPEFIFMQNEEKTNVILAGEISNIIKRQYKSKRNKNEGELNYYYTFDIKDETSKIQAIHFSTKSNEEKLNALTEDMQVLLLGDIRKNTYEKLTFFVKAISHCEIDKNKSMLAYEQSKKETFFLSNTYRFVKPKPFVDTYQQNLFFEAKYNDLIKENAIVVFDVETTGLEPEFAEIIEIGAVKVKNGQIIETFQSLVKPQKEIPSTITQITQIDNEMTMFSPSIAQVLSDFILFSKDCVLSGYNVNFDMRFIQKAGANMGYHFKNRVEDTMAFARNQLRLGNYTLKNVAKNLQVSLNQAHRALNDALATARVLIKLNQL